jgi:DNA-binding NarL/FixJ family response regulator
MGERNGGSRGARLAFLRLTPKQRLAVFSVPLATADAVGSLTAAEREVVSALLAGLANREIAAQRRCSVRTVANQVASVFRKTGVRSRAELAALLMREGPPGQAL